MEVNNKELKYIINESIKLLMESGSLGSDYEDVADEIIDKVESNTRFFDIDMPNGDFLIVSVKDENDNSQNVKDEKTGESIVSKNMFINPQTKTLTIWKTDETMDNIKPKLMHELTHYVNSLNSRPAKNHIVPLKEFEMYNAASYLFQDTELNARLTEFYYWLKNGNAYRMKSIYDANDILKIREMETVLYHLSQDYHKMTEQDKISLVQCLRNLKYINKSYRNNPNSVVNYRKEMNLHDYAKSKKSICNQYRKKAYNYFHKALKIWGMYRAR